MLGHFSAVCEGVGIKTAAAVSKQIKVSRGLVHMSEESSGVVLHTNHLKGELLEGLFLLHLT